MLKLHTRHKDPNSLTVNGVKGIDGDMSFGNLTYSDLKKDEKRYGTVYLVKYKKA